MNIYLAQSLINYTDHSLIHLVLKQKLRNQNHTVFDPLEFEVNLADPASIVSKDLEYVKKSNLLIADLTYPSLGGGTFGEIYHAFNNQIPVYIIQPPACYGPWMQTCTKKHFWHQDLVDRNRREDSFKYHQACGVIQELILRTIESDPELY